MEHRNNKQRTTTLKAQTHN